MDDVATELLRGPRGRRLCLTYAAELNETLASAVFDFAHALDPNPGMRIWLVPEGEDPDALPDEPEYTENDIAAMIDATDLSTFSHETLRHAMREAVISARYWQPADGTDVGASLPAIRGSLQRVAEHLLVHAPDLGAADAGSQWATDWNAVADSGPLPRDPAAALAQWTAAQHAGEGSWGQRNREQPEMKWTGEWWSVPPSVLRTHGSFWGVISPVEDEHGWTVATAIPVHGMGRIYNIRTDDDWVSLCREYPMDVTESRRHDWFDVTGRVGAWVIPDWERVAEDWDAVHLTTLAYLSSATRLIEVDTNRGTVIGGWEPDSTIWLADVAREYEGHRQQWERPQGEEQWRQTSG